MSMCDHIMGDYPNKKICVIISKQDRNKNVILASSLSYILKSICINYKFVFNYIIFDF